MQSEMRKTIQYVGVGGIAVAGAGADAECVEHKMYEINVVHEEDVSTLWYLVGVRCRFKI